MKKIFVVVVAFLVVCGLGAFPVPKVGAEINKANIKFDNANYNPAAWNTQAEWWAQIADTWASIPYRLTVTVPGAEEFICGVACYHTKTKAISYKLCQPQKYSYQGRILLTGLCCNSEYIGWLFKFKKGEEKLYLPPTLPKSGTFKFKTKLPKIGVFGEKVNFLNGGKDKDHYTIQAYCASFMERKCYVEIFIYTMCDNLQSVGPAETGIKYWIKQDKEDAFYGPGPKEEVKYFTVNEPDRQYKHYYRYVFTWREAGRWVEQKTEWKTFQIPPKS